MTSLPPGARPIEDLVAVAEEFAVQRTRAPEKVLHVKDMVRVYDATGAVFIGRIAGVERRQVPHPERYTFRVVCEPLAADGQGG